MSPHKRLTGALAGVLIGAGSVAGLPPGPAAAAPAAPAPAQSATPRAAQAITLVTGDVVQLAPAGDGRVAATVRPGPGRERISFTTTETEDGVRVVPSDAVRPLADGRLDAELFDVQHLIDSGFGDTASPTLPLIVKSSQGAATARSLGAPAGKELPSIGAVAVRADKDSLADFWRTQVGSDGARSAGAAAEKIWLDGKVKSLLDRSTAQIGAPDAWKAGLDGKGVKVAVLDTGVDPTHPDLAGRIAEKRDFSGVSEDAVDHHGHGTHVASTVAGSGAGSNGTRKGVAPGAQLVIGKVLDDSGSGSESMIISGMEWAARSGARIVSMSLGGSSTDGTDPMSVAVDELTAETGALFVIAAGNEGGDYTVGTPGVAKTALTVGAVDRDDHMADFSSRGPRVGDEGLKPEITAPGVGIVAARAAGTSMGGVVDELYTSASGTSMATPHVAGAAAIIAQQHPDWTGAQIKDELVSTAKTTAETSVYAQGAGRVDLTRATSQQVFGTGVADFGLRELGETPAQVTRKVTYSNSGTAAVTLSLSDDVDQVTTSATTVTVPAGGSADVTLTFDQSKASPGRFSGWLTATGASGVKVTTAIGGLLDGPRHTVTFKAINRSGEPAAVPALQVFGDDQRFDILDYFYGTSRTYQVGEGDYLVDALIPDGVPLDEQDTLVTIPELKVDRDLTVVLDARTAKPIRIETPKPAEQQSILSYYVHRVTGTGRGIINGFMSFSTTQAVNVTPTAKLRKGSYEFSSRWQLVAPLVQASIPGVTGPLDVNLCVYSPAYEGTRRFDLVKGLNGNVRGKAVVVEGDQNQDEVAAAAAAAGAAFALVALPADRSAWQPWSPEGDRMPIPTALVPWDDAQKILARAAKPGASITLTLTPNSPYLYDVFQVTKDRVPSQIVHKVTAANSYRITSSYPHNGGFDWIKEQRFGWRPAHEYSWNDAARQIRTPSVRAEWVSTGDTVWQHQVHHAWPWGGIGGSLEGGIWDDATSYAKAGSSSEVWNAPVVRPATPAGHSNTRSGNVLNLRIASFVDSSDRHYLLDRAPATLYRNGAELATLTDGWQDVPVPAGNATYKLSLTTERNLGDDWLYGRSTATDWTFKSGADGKLPLLQVGYSAPVSSSGVATKLPHVLGVKVPGAAKVKVETSADEGKTWKAALTLGSAVIVPAGKGTVSLRVTASDKSGNSVTQTVIRAYGRS